MNSRNKEQPVCRLCLKRDSEMDDMLMISNLNMIDKIYQCTTILIREDTDLPTTLCSECLNSIRDMYDFRQKSIKNQTFFLSIKIELDDPKSTDDFKSGEIHLPENERNDDSENDKKEYRTRSGNKRRSKLKKPPSRKRINIEEPEMKLGLKNIPKKGRLSKGKNKNPIPGMIPCEVCGKMLPRCRMDGHINTHAGVRPYICDSENCDKSFHDKARLYIHKLDYHTGIIHECDICGKPFAVLSSLRSHKFLHLAPRYNCTICDKKYRKKTRLQEHMRFHTGERPFKCSLCGKSFVHKSKLTIHMRSHTGEKPYKCDHCPVSYGYCYMLRKHNEKFHPFVFYNTTNVVDSK